MGQEGSREEQTSQETQHAYTNTHSHHNHATPNPSHHPFTPTPPIPSNLAPVEAVTLAGRQRPKASFAPSTVTTFNQPPVPATVLHSMAKTGRQRKVPPLVTAVSSAVKKSVTHGEATMAYLDSLARPNSPLDHGQIDVVSRVKKQIEDYREMAARHREEQARAMKIIFDQQLQNACTNQEDDEACEHQAKKPCHSVEQFTTPPTVPLSPAPFWSPGASDFGSDYAGAQFETMRDDANIDSYFADEAKELDNHTLPSFDDSCAPMADVEEPWQPISTFPNANITNCSPLVAALFDPNHPIQKRTVDLRSTKLYLENLKELKVLEHLERAYKEGRSSFDSIRQGIGFMKEQLQPEDYDQLLGPFASMSLTPATTTTTTTSEDDSSSSSSGASDGSSVATDGKATSVIQAAMRALPTYSNDLLPLEAAPDDSDGVPRFRVTMFFSSPNRAASIAKRKQSVDEIIQTELALHHRSPTALATAAEKDPFATDDSPLCIYRMMQCNVAHERMSGFSQRDMVDMFRAIGQRIQFKFVRKDHVKALHKILMGYSIHQKHEGHLYQVRINRDGSETYCLVHFVKNFVDGVFSQGVMSMVPLPIDPLHPPPPYVEGVDLPIETLLYGYKPPTPLTPQVDL